MGGLYLKEDRGNGNLTAHKIKNHIIVLCVCVCLAIVSTLSSHGVGRDTFV